MRQNMVFSTFSSIIRKKILGEGVQPRPRPFPHWGGGYPLYTPYPFCACGTSTPPILKSWVRHCVHIIVYGVYVTYDKSGA